MSREQFYERKILFCVNGNVLSGEILQPHEFQNNYFLLSHLKLSIFIPIMSKYFILVLLKYFFWYIVL